ncbi:hypothetical protein [Azospirillum brasilense]|uniref:hypothetical protein n=1 Tax=Azospirillum brasilense TaxID=192 RepID=UPI0011EFA76B|nr:hypothetical protein [Azospirillum brasilense]
MSEKEESKLKSVILWTVIIFSPAPVLILKFDLSIVIKLLLMSAVTISMFFIGYYPVRKNEISDERMTFSDIWRDFVYGSGRNAIWFFFVICVFLALSGVAVVFIGHGELWPRLALLGGSVLSAASSLVLLLKTRQAVGKIEGDGR